MFIEILWLIIPWIIWLLLKWRNWHRPSLSIMLIYSAAIVIFDIRYWQRINTLSEAFLIDTSFSWFQFLAGLSFWSIILYVPIAPAIKPMSIFDQRNYWWIALSVIALAVWHLFLPGSLDLINAYLYYGVMTTDIFFYTVLGVFVPWFMWLLLGEIERPRPSVPIMLLYSISSAIVSARFWDKAFICKLPRYVCEINFSLPLFLVEVALWFIPLYALLKLISRVEAGNKLVELAEKRKGQPIGTE